MRKTLNLAKRVEVYEFLKHNIKVIDAKERIVEYINSMNDDSVCKMFGISNAQVRGIREEMFGKLRVARVPSNTAIELRITAIEEYLTSKNPNWRG